MTNKDELSPAGELLAVNAPGVQPAQVINNDHHVHAGDSIREDEDIGNDMTENITIYSRIKFDMLKIAVSYKNARPFYVLDPGAFYRKDTEWGPCYSYQDEQRNLSIRYGQTKLCSENNEIVIKFTPNSLGKSCMQLISADNIHTFLKRLDEEYHLIHIYDLDKFIRDAYVLKCDVTIDDYIDDTLAKQFLDFTINNCKNSRATIIHVYKNNNFYIQNNVDAKSDRRRRLTFYDKYERLKKMKKAGLLPDGMDIERYRGLRRLELNLLSPQQIKELLHVKSNELMTVLHSTAQPIKEVYEKFVSYRQNCQMVLNKKQDYFAYLVAKDCGYNMSRIERKLRGLYKSWNTSRLIPYQAICNEKKNLNKDIKDLTQKIKDLLTIKYQRTVKINKRKTFPLL